MSNSTLLTLAIAPAVTWTLILFLLIHFVQRQFEFSQECIICNDLFIVRYAIDLRVFFCLLSVAFFSTLLVKDTRNLIWMQLSNNSKRSDLDKRDGKWMAAKRHKSAEEGKVSWIYRFKLFRRLSIYDLWGAPQPWADVRANCCVCGRSLLWDPGNEMSKQIKRMINFHLFASAYTSVCKTREHFSGANGLEKLMFVRVFNRMLCDNVHRIHK